MIALLSQTNPDQPNLEGSSLLAVMDDFLFNHFDQEGNLVMRNIGKDMVSIPVPPPHTKRELSPY